MNHSFLIINNDKINKLIEKIEENQKINFIHRLILQKWCIEQLSAKDCVNITHEIFIQLNQGSFTSYSGNLNQKSNGYNCYGYTIIPHSSIDEVIRGFTNLTKDELERLKDTNINEKEYEKITKPLIKLLAKAKEANKSVLHLGV